MYFFYPNHCKLCRSIKKPFGRWAEDPKYENTFFAIGSVTDVPGNAIKDPCGSKICLALRDICVENNKNSLYLGYPFWLFWIPEEERFWKAHSSKNSMLTISTK